MICSKRTTQTKAQMNQRCQFTSVFHSLSISCKGALKDEPVVLRLSYSALVLSWSEVKTVESDLDLVVKDIPPLYCSKSKFESLHPLLVEAELISQLLSHQTTLCVSTSARVPGKRHVAAHHENRPGASILFNSVWLIGEEEVVKSRVFTHNSRVWLYSAV